MIDHANAPDQPAGFEIIEVAVQRGAADLAIIGQLHLRGETAVVRVEPVTQVPEHDLGGGLEPALLDGPVGGGMAHGAALPVGETTRVVNP